MRLLLAALALIVGTMPAAAQWLNRPWPGIPRTAEGKPNLTAPAPRGPDGKPDLTGVWNGPTPEPRLDRVDAQPWVDDLVRQRQQDYHKGRPSYQCLPSGPEADRFARWKRILQTPTAIAILNDDLTYRVIFMDGRELEANPAPGWMGYSVGRWDGDTLIVDSFGFNEEGMESWRTHPQTSVHWRKASTPRNVMRARSLTGCPSNKADGEPAKACGASLNVSTISPPPIACTSRRCGPRRYARGKRDECGVALRNRDSSGGGSSARSNHRSKRRSE